MKCPECYGTAFTKGQFDVAQIVRQQPVLVRNVPASKCSQCGYLVITAAAIKRIEKALRERAPDTQVPADVYDLAGPVQSGHPHFAHTSPVGMKVAGTAV